MPNITVEAETDNDLEDGEIRDELEDISDCSLSEIVSMKQELGDDSDIDLLREEALKSIYEKEEANDEALEEEQYRLEALKSLLKNIELTEKEDVAVSGAEPKKKLRKRKREVTHKHRKRKTSKQDLIADEISKSLMETNVVPGPVSDHVTNENKTDVISGGTRSWYPKTDFALIDLSFVENTNPHKEDEKPNMCYIDIHTSECSNSVPISSTIYREAPLPLAEIKVANRVRKVLLNNPCSNFKKVTKHCVRNFSSAPPVVNSNFTSRTQKKGLYKLVNKSNYVLKKSVSPKSTKTTSRSKSVYSINRVKYPSVKINPKEFIIKLSEDEEENSEESDAQMNTPQESYAKISSICSVGNNVIEDGSQIQQHKELKLEDKSLKVTKLPELTKNGRTANLVKKHLQSAIEGDIKYENTNHKDFDEYNESKMNIFSTHYPSSISNEEIRKSGDDNQKTAVVSIKAESSVEDDKAVKKDISAVLLEAETNLIQIREKLLSDLNDLDKAVTQNTLENEKLGDMKKKLLLLKTMVSKFKGRVKLQQSKVSMTVTYMNSLLSGVELRTKTCSKFKEICVKAGKNIVGFQYKPPDNFEDLIVERRGKIDFPNLEKNSRK